MTLFLVGTVSFQAGTENNFLPVTLFLVSTTLFLVGTEIKFYPMTLFLVSTTLFQVGTCKGNGLVFNGKHIMPEKLVIVLFYGAERADFTNWIIPLFVREMYLLVHKNGHSQKWGMSEKGEYKKVLR